MWKSIISSLFSEENLYIQALGESQKMLDIDLTMFEAATESLRLSNSGEVSIDVYQLDQKINAYERDVRKKVMTHLSVTGSRDLAPGLALVSVVIDIERIGDYTKNIYDLAKLHPARLDAGELEDDLQAIETHVAKHFKDMITAFKSSDEEMARKIMAGYKEDVSEQTDNIVASIVCGKIANLNPDDASAVVLYARYLKRIAAHSRNIITSVVNPFDQIGYKAKD
jgi:phosphate uptake regulator